MVARTAPWSLRRREFKYLLEPALLTALRRRVAPWCEVDPHGGADGSYVVRSLYLDTHDDRLYQANEREAAQRFKVRVRHYPENPGSRVFLEIKRRDGDIISKTRVPVDAHRVPALVAGRFDAASSPAERSFAAVCSRYDLQPRVWVDYRRHAWVSRHDHYARVSVDQGIRAQLARGLAAPEGPWRAVDQAGRAVSAASLAVVELKFGSTRPRWMVSLVQQLELTRRSFSKYCYGLEAERSLPSDRIPTARWA